MTNSSERTKLVVVFPAYNKATSIRASLQCIADQTFREFEAIILENQSTDGTLEEAEAFCKIDSRFHIVRNETHLAALDTFAKAIQIGAQQGEYFCLRACDDLSSLDFLEQLVRALDENPEKLVAACPTKLVGDIIRLKTPNPNTFNFVANYCAGRVPRNLNFPAEWLYAMFRPSAADMMLARWQEYANPWCQASFIMSEFVVCDLIQYVEEPTFDFIEGSGSIKIYAAHGFKEKLRHRMNYTLGCYRLHKKLPSVGIATRLRFLRMCWNDSRRKTQFKLFGML